MKTTKLLFIALVTATILYSCKDNPVNPGDNLRPGRRDYVWTVDTLNYPYNTMYRMWGSSPTNVWTTSSGDWDKSISHFDGEKWSSSGISGIINPNAIFGFSSNNVFIGGAGNGKIWNFDGNSWRKFAELTKDGHNDIYSENIWGESSNDFYVFGAYPSETGAINNSVIGHYSNNKWEILNTSGLYGTVEHVYKNKADKKIYLRAITVGGSVSIDSSNIYEYLQGKFNKIYSSAEDYANISLINNEVYFILDKQIAKRVNNQFQTVLNVDVPNFYNNIWGRNSKDIFLTMTDGLAHYNGSDIEYLFYFDKKRTQIFGSALFNNEVFFLIYESQTNLNLIYHGKLK